MEAVFSPENMAEAWAKYVRPGLRDQEVLDLFDYNDFHWNRRAVFQHLNQSIVDGRYRPNRSMAARLEKKLGVCRTIVTPIPEDAVVLQCIVEWLLPKVVKAQPSSNSFFSRSHTGPNAEFQFGTDYIWFKKWRQFSKRRIAITSAHDWVVTTDISTFYDNINHSHLRNILSVLDGTEEVVLDILLSLIDEVSWRPDYLPSVGVGLPQVQFDAPRLLAHAYLFEIDQYLKDSTANNFVRWVDDITFAVDSRVVGKKILRDLDALLQLRGVRLNSGKTRVLSKQQAREYFHGRANEFLDRIKIRIDEAIKEKRSTYSLSNRLRDSFDRFVLRDPVGHHDKICKRYIGLFIALRDPHAIRFCASRLVSEPGLRDTIYRYFALFSDSGLVERSLFGYLRGGDALDDASVCQIAKILTQWEVKPKTARFRALARLGIELADHAYLSRSHFYLVASIWLVAKYGSRIQLRRVLENTESLWSNSEFLSRQVAASAARFSQTTPFRWLSLKIEKHGFRSAVSVINYLRQLQSYDTSIPSDVRMYILNGKNKSRYSIQRFLVAHRVLTSDKLPAARKDALRSELLEYISDPHYRAVMQAI